MTSQSDIIDAKLLIVDDEEANIQLLERLLRSAGYASISTTTDPKKVCELHAKNHYDLILLDLRMPEMDGFQVMEELNGIEPDTCLPVLVITAQPSHKLRALQAGARDFIGKPFELTEVLARVNNLVEMRLLQKRLQAHNVVLEVQVKERTADLRSSYLETIFAMTRAAEYRDCDVGAHVERISYYSRELARLLGQDDTFIDTIFFASPMHDVGKIGIPDHILLKPGPLTPEEWEVMKEHTAKGSEILGSSNSPYLRLGAEIALGHHECWDGGGYPNGLRGDDIPLAARIIRICDVYDALRSKRPYKPAFDHEKAVKIITKGDGRTEPEHFDPAVLAGFAQSQGSFSDIFEELA